MHLGHLEIEFLSVLFFASFYLFLSSLCLWYFEADKSGILPRPVVVSKVFLSVS
jgi:hypothetical protein